MNLIYRHSKILILLLFSRSSVFDGNEKVGGRSLRGVLHNLKLQDGHTLFREIHQVGPMGCVDVVAGNMVEANQLIETMNKNVGFYLYYVLNS